jgi:uncharacterized protein (TIGR03083 family)
VAGEAGTAREVGPGLTKYTRKDELLKDIQTEHRRLEKLLASLSEEQLLLPGAVGDWSVKDVIAHLVEWERLFLEWYRCGIEGTSPAIQPVGMGRTAIDQLNRGFYERSRLRPLPEVLADFKASYQEILDTLQVISEEEMFTPGRYAWTGRLVLADYIAANTCSHYHWASGKIKLLFETL